MKSYTVNELAEFLERRWTIQILMELHEGDKKEKRFNELKKKLGVTPKRLTKRLDELECEGLIIKKVSKNKKSTKTEIYLAESGVDFVEIVIPAIKLWGEKWKNRNEKSNKSTGSEEALV